jgi:hypothetical protein
MWTLLTWTSSINIVAMLLVVIVVTGCKSNTSNERELGFMECFPYDDMNHSLQLQTIEGLTETHIGSIITLQVENHSNTAIAFPVDYGVRGLSYDPSNTEWVEFPNKVQFCPDVQRVLGAQGSTIPNFGLVDYEPELDETPASLDIRIVVVGHVNDETYGLGEPVAAYLDLTLEN